MGASDTCVERRKNCVRRRSGSQKDFRNAEKRRRRLRARCKELPAEDLLEVLAMRRVRDAAAAEAASEEEPRKD